MAINLRIILLSTVFVFASYALLADNPEIVVPETTESTQAESSSEEEVVVVEEEIEESSDDDSEVVKLEKVVVTGSRIKRSQVEGASPLIVITKQDMQNNGYRNLTEALQSLPFASDDTQNEQQTNTFTPNASELDLRRFGPGRVLILVNGRRMADYPQPFNNSSNFVNTGTIPAGLVDRIEILSNGSSAVYGSDAVTGVVNVITTQGKDFTEVEWGARNYDNGNDNIFDLTVTSGGFSGNHSWTVGANLYHIDPMYYADRPGFDSFKDNPRYDDPTDPLYGEWATADYLMSLLDFNNRNETGAAQTAALGYACNEFYPTGFAYKKSDYGYSGSYPGTYCSQDISDDKRTLVNERDEATFMGTYNYNFDNGMTLSARAFYWESTSYLNSFSRWFYLPSVIATVPADVGISSAYGGPLGSDPKTSRFQYVRTFGGQTGPNSRRESEYSEDVTDLFVGLEGVYDNGWDWNAGYSTTTYNMVTDQRGLTTDVYDWATGADKGATMDMSPYLEQRGDLYYNAAYAFGSQAYLNYANYYYGLMGTAAYVNHPCGYDAFTDPLTGSVASACLDSERAFGPVSDSEVGKSVVTEQSGAETSSTMIDYNVTGELDIQLSGGPIAFSAIAEYHEQDYLLQPDQRRIDSDNEVAGVATFISGSARQGGGDRNRTSVGLEVFLPISAKFDSTIALRSDEYDDESSAVGRRQSAMVNFAYRPNAKLLVRGSAAQSFRAPDMHYVYAGSSSYFDSVTDYAKCYQANPNAPYIDCEEGGTIKGRFEGNKKLEEESGENFSLGFVWDVAEGMSFSMDAFHIMLDGAVVNLDTQTIANREGFCLYGASFGEWIGNDYSDVNCVTTLASIKRGDTSLIPGSDASTLGDIEEIKTYNSNQQYEEFLGVDTTFRYSFSTENAGDWRVMIMNSNYLDRNRKEDAASPEVNILDSYIYQTRSAQNMTIGWRYDDWNVTYYVDRTGHTEQYYGQKGDPFLNENLTIGYRYNADLDLRFGIANIWDRMPERDSAYGYPYFNQGYYSVMGRSFTLSGNYRF